MPSMQSLLRRSNHHRVEGSLETCVTLIDVGMKLDLPGRIGPGGEIGQVDWNVFLKRNIAVLSRFDHVIDALVTPAQDMHGKFPRILHPNTSVTEGAYILREQFLGRCVMHVDVVRIGKEKFDAAKRVAISPRLSNGKRD